MCNTVLLLWLFFGELFFPSPWDITHFVYSNTGLITLHFILNSNYFNSKRETTRTQQERQMRKWILTAKTSWKEVLIFRGGGHRPKCSGPERCNQGTAVLAAYRRARVPLKGGWGLSPAPADYGNMLSIAKSPGILREAKNLYYGKFLDFENTMWAK